MQEGEQMLQDKLGGSQHGDQQQGGGDQQQGAGDQMAAPGQQDQQDQQQ